MSLSITLHTRLTPLDRGDIYKDPCMRSSTNGCQAATLPVFYGPSAQEMHARMLDVLDTIHWHSSAAWCIRDLSRR